MGLTISLDFWGDVQLKRTLERFTPAGADLTPAWGPIAQSFTRAEQRQFASQGAAGGAGWAPLSPNYAAWKARHYPGKPILRRTDELFRSLTVGPQVRVMRRLDLTLGSAVPHGRYHQHGQGLPRRRPVHLPEQLRQEWMKIIQRVLITGRA